MTNLKLLTALSALSLSFAFATSAPMSRNMVQSLSIIVRASDQVALLDASGRVLATVNANGTVNPTPGANLTNIAKLAVTIHGATTVYTVSTAADGQTLVTGLDATGRTTTVPLGTFIQRLVQGAPLPGQVRNDPPQNGNGQPQNSQYQKGQDGEHKDGEHKDGQHKDGQQNGNGD